MAVSRVMARRIWENGLSFEDVSPKYQNKVLQVMQENVADGLHTPEEYKEKTGMDYPVVESEE